MATGKGASMKLATASACIALRGNSKGAADAASAIALTTAPKVSTKLLLA